MNRFGNNLYLLLIGPQDVADIPSPLESVLVTEPGLVSNHHINPAEQKDIRKIHSRQIPDNPLWNQEIDAAGNPQKEDYQGKQEYHGLLKSSGVIQGIIKCSPTPGRYPVLLEQRPQLHLQIPVMFPQFAGLLCNPFLHSLTLGLLPLCPGLLETFLSFSNLLVIAGVNLIQTLPDSLVH